MNNQEKTLNELIISEYEAFRNDVIKKRLDDIEKLKQSSNISDEEKTNINQIETSLRLQMASFQETIKDLKSIDFKKENIVTNKDVNIMGNGIIGKVGNFGQKQLERVEMKIDTIKTEKESLETKDFKTQIAKNISDKKLEKLAKKLDKLKEKQGKISNRQTIIVNKQVQLNLQKLRNNIKNISKQASPIQKKATALDKMQVKEKVNQQNIDKIKSEKTDYKNDADNLASNKGILNKFEALKIKGKSLVVNDPKLLKLQAKQVVLTSTVKLSNKYYDIIEKSKKVIEEKKSNIQEVYDSSKLKEKIDNLANKGKGVIYGVTAMSNAVKSAYNTYKEEIEKSKNR